MFKSLVYAKNCELWWLNFLNDITDYKPKTTFFSDLSIAEYFGINAIKDTYNKVLKEWKNNIEYFTEFTMCLNHKSWQFSGKNDELCDLYVKLYYNALDFADNNFNNEELSYFYRILD